MSYKASEVIKKVREIVTERPDNEYRGNCKYTEGQCLDGSIGCLIGQAILQVYPDLKEELTIVDNVKTNGNSITDILGSLQFDFTQDEYDWLNLIQVNQDSGEEWGNCVKFADSNLPNVEEKTTC